MSLYNEEDLFKKTVDEINNELLDILSEVANTVSMEEKYINSGLEIKKQAKLAKILERIQCLQKDIDEEKNKIIFNNNEV
ncbi:MAG: hypothetical protein PHO27_01140 [Sulfuricurvum sp.]|nr:hypothetical protein [Sulfuricurvum sp.]